MDWRTKINKTNDISEFILDIAIRKNNLEDSYNLLDENIEGFITRLDKKNYKLELKCIGTDEESNYNILIDENIKLYFWIYLFLKEGVKRNYARSNLWR